MPEEQLIVIINSIKEWTAVLGGAAVAILTLCEFLSKQWKPWSLLLRRLGVALNKDLYDKMNDIEADTKDIDKKVQNLSFTISENEAKNARKRILRFSDEVFYEVHHSKEHFDEILDDITDYENYCSAHPDFKNNKTILAVERIKKVYADCLEKNSFL